MVAGNVMRWSPWAPSATERKKRYHVRVRVIRLEGLPASGDERSRLGLAAVAIRWKGPPRDGGMRYLGRRRKQARGVSGKTPVRYGGVAEWEAAEEDDENAFAHACCFCKSYSDSNPNAFRPWDVSFSLLHGFEDGGKKKKKLEKIGDTSVNIAEWIWASKSDVHRKQIPIALPNGNSAMLYVNLSFEEVRSSDETSDWRVTDDSCSFDSNIMDLSQLLRLEDESDQSATYSSRNGASAAASSSSSSGGRSPELQLGSSAPKPGFFSWGKRTKSVSSSTESRSRKTHASSSSSTTFSDCSTDADPIGRWENREFVSRDRRSKLKARVFFASIDQRDESAAGESACTALVAVIADALHSNGPTLPTRSEFDALIREGSSEWRKLCDDASYIARFPNKHFDLDTVLSAGIRPISVLPEKSFVGFFEPESFESLRGAMSFERIWDEISGGGEPTVYVVSWNDHFFLLKVDGDAYYVVDTLGERLFEGCNRAYMLRFDKTTKMYRLPEGGRDGAGDEVVCRGKECCREFIKEFLAAIPVREELEMEEKRRSSMALHQRLQIEFHHTVACDKIMKDDADWR